MMLGSLPDEARRSATHGPGAERSATNAAGENRRQDTGGLEPALHAVVDSVDNGVLLLDAQGGVRYGNPRFAGWMGIEAVEWPRLEDFSKLVRRLAPQFRESKEFAARWEAIQQGEEAVWDELEQVAPERRLIERLSRPLFDAQGKKTGRLEIYRDATGERYLHSKLLQTEKMAALGQLVSGMAHELNNPLTSIMGYAQLALAREEPGSNAGHAEASAARHIFDEAQRAHRIVRNLLLFARETKPERAAVRLNEIVERTLALRSYELKVKNIAVWLELAPELPLISGDAHQLQQVVLNLLVNAEQAVEARAAARAAASPQGQPIGSIGLRTRVTAGDEERVVLEVCDDGRGVAPEVASKIFDPFFSTKPVGVGTGLGLSIVYGIVREHGGEISVRSPEASRREQARWRTVFTVELPVMDEAANVAPQASGNQEGAALMGEAAGEQKAGTIAIGRCATPAHRVLIIEDEPTVARLVDDVLRDDGVESEIAVGGQAGLDRLLAARKPGFDLVICDLKMPSLDGPALYRELLRRNHPAKDRILFITGDTLSRRTLEFLETHKARYVAKPFLPDELRVAVRRCLPAAEPRAQKKET